MPKQTKAVSRAIEALEVDSEWPADRLLDAIEEALAILTSTRRSSYWENRARRAEGLLSAMNHRYMRGD